MNVTPEKFVLLDRATFTDQRTCAKKSASPEPPISSLPATTPQPNGSSLKGQNSTSNKSKPITEVHRALSTVIEPPRTPKGAAANGNAKSQSPEQTYSPPNQPANDNDKAMWQGFCEIESDPAYFTIMLSEFGIRDVKVQELFSLDMMDELPQPVHGLVLLYRYREVDTGHQEPCPDNVWFANQTAQNACATTALINIMMNASGVDLGEPLLQFKHFTETFTPALRGQEIANFEFVKRIHNSFAKKTDMLHIDLSMKESWDARDKPKPKPKSKKRKADEFGDDPNAAFHFIAYVPVDGDIWKLDGLDFEPSKIGSYTNTDWLPVVRAKLDAIMASGRVYDQEDVQYTLLAVVKDPLATLRADLAVNIKTAELLERRLDQISADWRAFAPRDDDDREPALRGPSEELGVGVATLDNAAVPESLQQRITADGDVATLLDRHGAVVGEQAKLRMDIRSQQWAREDDERKARERRHDFGPMIGVWLKMLAKKGVLEEMVAQNK
ncbi:cysteine proteinase [Lepidopterella palustris CBS 459.81]|uniref:ubiquitinyl hydrolase 1 n=1 Tax=Lepidopterella palustris CBS 459.81 TaxID=1314670 RepID=A0A8E2EBJ8_9PEZI|nr:cysteine proteinase [Lepidopterella palustris CBS 459.81]